MRRRRLFSVLSAILTLLLSLSVSQASGTLAADGKVKKGVYANSAGITFTVPEGYAMYSQKMKDTGFLRVLLNSENFNFHIPIVVDVRMGPIDMKAFGEEQYLAELVKWPKTSVDRYYYPYLLAFSMEDEGGVMVQNTLAAFWNSDNQFWYSHLFCFSRAWCTENYYVRVSLFNLYNPENLITDCRTFPAFCDSLTVP
jgi:hypothetical protein